MSLLLEDFGSVVPADPRDDLSDRPPSAAASAGGDPSASFEQGYREGWDDAVRAEAENQAHIAADLAHNLQDLGFTFHEARAQVLRSLDQFLREIVETLLPRLVRDTIGERIIEELTPIAGEIADTPLEVVVAPSALQTVRDKVEGVAPFPVRVVAEPTLGPGQVHLRAGVTEKRLDIDAVSDRLTTALRDLRALNSEVASNG